MNVAGFNYALRRDRHRGGNMAFINYVGGDGESHLAGTLVGWDSRELDAVALMVTTALNAWLEVGGNPAVAATTICARLDAPTAGAT